MKSVKAVKKYTLYTLFVVLMTVSISSMFALMEIHNEAIFLANIELNQRMKIFKEYLTHNGENFSSKNGQLFAGNRLLNGNFEIPDKLSSIFDGTFTIFMGDTRISTSIRMEDRTRIVDTKLVGPAYDAIFVRGEAYHGEADIQGTKYITTYEPIKDSAGSIIGALYTGVKKDVYLSQYNKLRFGIVGILFCIVIVFSVLYYFLFKQGMLAEQQSANNLAFLQTLIDTIPNPVYYKNFNGNYLGCNFAFESLFGVNKQDVIGKMSQDLINREVSSEQEKIELGLLSAPAGAKYTSETQITTNDGITKDIIIFKACFQNKTGLNAGIVGSILDITERKHLQKVMIQTEKMLMVGGLAAGMAHELNNPLCSILQNTQNIQRRLSAEFKANKEVANNVGLNLKLMQPYLEQRGIYEMLDFISTASVRAADIVSNLLSFCKKGSVVLAAVQLNQLIDNAIELACCDYELRIRGNISSINFVKEYDNNISPVVINRSEIEQVLINLIKNAVQALNDVCSGDSAKIVFRTRQADKQVVIEVEDNGPGISQEIKGRIFEPFFTTKEVGTGTGMGLSVAYALVVNNHNGSIEVDSIPGGGTKFSIILPLIKQDAS